MNALAMHPVKAPCVAPPLPTYLQATRCSPHPSHTPHERADTFEQTLPQTVAQPQHKRARVRALCFCSVLAAASACLGGLVLAFTRQWRQAFSPSP